MKTKTVEVQITYTVSGKKNYTFPANMSIADMQKAVELQLENEGFIEDTTNFKCTFREFDADVIQLLEKS